MPRLKHLRFTGVGVRRTDDTKAAVTVLADDLGTLRMSCRWCKQDRIAIERLLFVCVTRRLAVFTKYSLFRLRAPKLAVFEWRCCYADEVRIEAVGRLSDVAIKVDAGRTRTPTPIGTEPKYVTIKQCDKLVTDILQGLMPGLQPRTWKDVTRVKYPHVGKEFLLEADTGAWSLQLPPTTVESEVVPLHGPAHRASAVRFIAKMSVTSDTMPRLKHLRFTDVSVRTDDTKAAVTVLVDDLRTLRMSCRWHSKIESPSEPLLYLCHSGVIAVFTKYSLFRLCAPKLAVFEWRCCYADEVRIEAVGRLSDVAIEVDAGRTRTPTPIETEPKYVTIQQRDKLVTDILQGLMPGLQPRTWKDVTRQRYLSPCSRPTGDVIPKASTLQSMVTDMIQQQDLCCMSKYSKTESPSEPLLFLCHLGVTAVFTKYSFRLRAPKLPVFEWRCCYADEVRIEAVGRLSDVTIDVDTGSTRTPTPIGTEPKYVTIQQRDKLVTDILQGLMTGLQPRTWRDVTSKTESPSEPLLFLCHLGVTAVFTKYSLFRLRAPKLPVFEWRCCYADELRIEAVGRLSDFAIEVDAGRTRTPTPIGMEPKYVTIQQCDKLLTDILQGLMPGLQPCTWKDVTRVKYPHVDKEFLPEADAGAWSLQLPPATVEQQDLHIGECTLDASMSVTSDTMPRLKHLRFTDLSVRTDDTKAAVTVLADDLRTLRKSCRWYSQTESPSEPLLFLCHSGVTAVFTKYSLFRLRAPKLAVFEWRCCYADEVRIEAVGRLSDVAIEVDARRTRTPTPIGMEPKFVTIQQRDKLVTDILQGLMTGLQPRTWKDVTRVKYPHVGKEFLPEADAGAWSLQLPPATVEQQVLPFCMSVTSDTMPRLKHLRFTDVSVRTDDTKAAVTVLADDLRTLRMSCRWYSKTESPSEPLLFLCHSGVTAVFTKYSLFRLRAPKLAVFEWRCCYADEVRIEAVGRLSDVAIEVDARRTRTPTPIGTEPKFVTIQQRDKLVTDILQGLMPGLQPHTWKDVTSKTESPSEPLLFLCHSGITAVFTKYSLFRLRAPKLAVFEWRCCYADEVRIEAVGRLSDVAIEVDAGRTRTPTPIGPEPKYVTIQQRDKLVTDILQGLMPGLQPRTWKGVTRYVYTRL
ncbi:unnamed protein product [Miscanthus lutarioriparius]|uniref:Uncharacterized protein n=1 Tax=Miscanthus lutarioriparius TaxID=422564 RepID=A0A811S3Q9_9POAL|nr:unnamed protein product [Miscanthus lutarioriparius]